jgi:hypothetical protein
VDIATDITFADAKATLFDVEFLKRDRNWA